MSGRVLDVNGLNAGYDGSAVVRDLDLHVDAGEVVALLGPNGAGKTTTLLAVSGLAETIGGSITVLGRPGPSLKRAFRLARQGVAHVPENRGLFNQLTTRENVELGPAGKAGIPAVVELFPELERLLDRKVGLLSGGEQQMVALGRAIAGRPKLLMIDELSFGLAPALVERLLPVVRLAATEGDAGVLLVEQRTDLALEHADRGYVLSHGDLVATDSATRLKQDEALLRGTYLGDSEGDSAV